MTFKWITFGKLMGLGINSFRQASYEQAKSMFEKAAEINENDYLVNFWLFRIYGRLGLVSEAKNHAAKCISLRPDLEKLFTPLKMILENGIASKEQWLELDIKLEQYIIEYQKTREYSIKDIFRVCTVFLIIFFLVMVFFALCRVFNIPIFEILDRSPSIKMLLDYAPLIPLIWIYYSKPKLVTNYWIKIQDLACLMTNTRFLKWMYALISLKFLAVLLTLNDNVLIGSEPYLNTGAMLMVVIIGPICEEVCFRGLLFSYIKQYSRFFAYFVSVWLFYTFHGGNASYLHIMLGIFFALAYEKFDTLMAPIVLHSAQNVVFIIALVYHYRILPLFLQS